MQRAMKINEPRARELTRQTRMHLRWTAVPPAQHCAPRFRTTPSSALSPALDRHTATHLLFDARRKDLRHVVGQAQQLGDDRRAARHEAQQRLPGEVVLGREVLLLRHSERNDGEQRWLSWASGLRLQLLGTRE